MWWDLRSSYIITSLRVPPPLLPRGRVFFRILVTLTCTRQPVSGNLTSLEIIVFDVFHSGYFSRTDYPDVSLIST